jgi:hypothetical protein
MTPPAEYELLHRQVSNARDNGCDEIMFRALSKQAVAVYASYPELGETIAQQMTGLWYDNRQNWQSAAAEDIGQLFADLDVPPQHVSDGETGARQKWQALERRINDGGRTARPSDHRR